MDRLDSKNLRAFFYENGRKEIVRLKPLTCNGFLGVCNYSTVK